jgi:putative glutamine amidotransferase
VLATAPDGLIEAASLRGHPFYLLVQWHPEMLPEQRGLFASLIRASQAVAA